LSGPFYPFFTLLHQCDYGDLTFDDSWWFLSLFPEFTVFSGFVSKSDKKGVILGFVHKWSEKT